MRCSKTLLKCSLISIRLEWFSPSKKRRVCKYNPGLNFLSRVSLISTGSSEIDFSFCTRSFSNGRKIKRCFSVNISTPHLPGAAQLAWYENSAPPSVAPAPAKTDAWGCQSNPPEIKVLSSFGFPPKKNVKSHCLDFSKLSNLFGSFTYFVENTSNPPY